MAVRRPVTSRSTITSSICERPVSSHRIRLLVPAARPSTTTSVREVARVSITAGLLDRTRVIGVCTLTTTDLPTRMWSACPSEGAGTCGADAGGGAGAVAGEAGVTACAGPVSGASVVAGSCCAAPFNAADNNPKRTTRPEIFAALELFINLSSPFRPRLSGPASDRKSLNSELLFGPLVALDYLQNIDRLSLSYSPRRLLAWGRRRRRRPVRRQLIQVRGPEINISLVNPATQHKLHHSL